MKVYSPEGVVLLTSHRCLPAEPATPDSGVRHDPTHHPVAEDNRTTAEPVDRPVGRTPGKD